MKSRAIQDIINKVWFKSASRSKADAILFRELYEPFPLVALALTLTAVSFHFSLHCAIKCPLQYENSLDEWRTGSFVTVNFTAAEYKENFDDALAMLKQFDEDTKEHGIIPALQQAIFSAGW
jgi:hypothetical protein